MTPAEIPSVAANLAFLLWVACLWAALPQLFKRRGTCGPNDVVSEMLSSWSSESTRSRKVAVR